MYPITKKSSLISTVPFVVGTTQIKFDVPAELKQTGLQKVVVKAIQVFTTSTLAAINGLTPFTAADLLNLTLNLTLVNRKNVIVDLPTVALLRASNGGFYYPLDNLEVDWDKSYVKVQLATGLSAGEVLPIEVVFDSNNAG
jgi:hypothetical protein